jgi:hypothetical protein
MVDDRIIPIFRELKTRLSFKKSGLIFYFGVLSKCLIMKTPLLQFQKPYFFPIVDG